MARNATLLLSAEANGLADLSHLWYQKKDAFDSLTVDFYNAKDAKKKANAQVKSLSSQLNICLSQLKHFDKIKAELEDLKQ